MDFQQFIDEILFGGFRTFHAVALVLLILGIAWFVSVIITRPKGSTVLLLGPSGAGKTTLLHRLQYGSTLNGTVASMEPKEVETGLAGDTVAMARPVTLVDVPGHLRVRDAWTGWVKGTQGIVFVVDATDFLPQKTAIAEQMYDILSHPVILANHVPILLACNKMDMGLKAHSVEFVRKRLEKELDQLQSTRGTLDDVGGGRAATSRLLPESAGEQAVTFAALEETRGISVSIVGISAQEGDGIADVEGFIRSRVAP